MISQPGCHCGRSLLPTLARVILDWQASFGQNSLLWTKPSIRLPQSTFARSLPKPLNISRGRPSKTWIANNWRYNPKTLERKMDSESVALKALTGL